jgi:hypothetical protein
MKVSGLTSSIAPDGVLERAGGALFAAPRPYSLAQNESHRINALRCRVMAGLVPAIHAAPSAKCQAESRGCADQVLAHDFIALDCVTPDACATHCKITVAGSKGTVRGNLSVRDSTGNTAVSEAR